MEIVSFFIIAGIVVLIGLFLKYKNEEREIYTINQERINEEKEVLNKIREEIANTTIQNNNLKERNRELEESYENLRRAHHNSLNSEIESIKEARIKLTEKEIEEKINELYLKYHEEEQDLVQSIEKVKKELTDLKEKRTIIIEEQKRKEEILNNKKFYSIQLKEYDKEDIIKLRSIEHLLNNKEVLNKLIYENYYRKPLTDLFGRIAGIKKPCGIYKITNILNDKAYIGKSVEIIPKRWTEHIKTSLGIGSISHTKIHDAIREEGADNFTFEILEECSKEKLSEREKYWIDFYETNTYGYNSKAGG